MKCYSDAVLLFPNRWMAGISQTQFRFPPNFVIQAGAQIAVWREDCSAQSLLAMIF
jgi:hypothetical protein